MAKLEVCVDSVESIRNAERGGACRLELCSALSLGGLTPSVGLLGVAKRLTRLPVFVMIRCRDGNFVYDDDDLLVMKEDVVRLKECGADGFVFGVLNDDGRVNKEACRVLLDVARPLPCTFHRAFDVVADPIQRSSAMIFIVFFVFFYYYI